MALVLNNVDSTLVTSDDTSITSDTRPSSPQVHRNGDLRICGATTIVAGQNTVYVNNRLWAVDNDPNSHGEGGLIPSGQTIFISGKKVIVHRPDNAKPDLLCIPIGAPHCNPATSQGSPNVFAYNY